MLARGGRLRLSIRRRRTIVTADLLNQVTLIMENPSSNTNHAPRVATMGEALIDLIARPDGLYEPCLGGAVYNLTRALALQGAQVDYLNPISADANGQALRAALQRCAVQVTHTQPSLLPTALAIAHLDTRGQASYSFYREQVADRATTAATLNALCADIDGLDAVCTGCLALAAADAGIVLPWLRTQRRQGRLVVVDANLRTAAMPDLAAYRQTLWQALGLADIIKASDDDLADLFGNPSSDPVVLGRELLTRSGARALALTLGARGAVLLLPDGRGWQAHDPQPVTVVDTVGAGDCFLAGLLVQWLASATAHLVGASTRAPNDARMQQALARGVASASLCVMRRGCAPPTAAEVGQRMRGVVVAPISLCAPQPQTTP